MIIIGNDKTLIRPVVLRYYFCGKIDVLPSVGGLRLRLHIPWVGVVLDQILCHCLTFGPVFVRALASGRNQQGAIIGAVTVAIDIEGAIQPTAQ